MWSSLFKILDTLSELNLLIKDLLENTIQMFEIVRPPVQRGILELTEFHYFQSKTKTA